MRPLRRLFDMLVERIWRPETGIFLAIWLALMVGGRSRLFRDPGTFWHTKVGEQLIASRHFIDHDPFSYTAEQLFPGEPWVPHQWLGECVMALIHQFRGWDSLLLTTVTLLAGLYTWLAHRLIRSGLHWAPAISLTALALAAGSSHFHVRPHLSTLIFFGLTCAAVDDFEMGRVRLRRMFWLVPMYVLWTNLHGGMLGGLCSLVLVVAGWGVAKLFRAPTPIQSWGQFLVLGALVIACGLAAFVNPYGWRIPSTWVKIMSMPHLSEIIEEHARLDPLKPNGAVVLFLGLVYLVVLAGLRPQQLRVSWLLPLVWLYLACDRVRHAPLFGIAAVLAIGDIFPHTRWCAALVRRGSDLYMGPEDRPPTAKLRFGPWVLPLAVLVLATGLQMRGLRFPILGSGWAQLDRTIWPLDLAEPLQRLPRGTRIFNELNLGGFLIYYAPQVRIFIDDRCELYGDPFLCEYDRVARTDPEFVESWARTFQFDVALTLSGSPLDTYFRSPESGWELVAATEAASLYDRRGMRADPSSERPHEIVQPLPDHPN